MFFPDEVFNNILSYFHTFYYRKPLHYKAIMDDETFSHRNKVSRRWNNSLLNKEYCCSMDSFYIYIVANNWHYWKLYDLPIVKPRISFNRKVAKGKVLNDFIFIWREYATNNDPSNLLSTIHYN